MTKNLTNYMIEHMWKNVRSERLESQRLKREGGREGEVKNNDISKSESCHGNRENILTPKL